MLSMLMFLTFGFSNFASAKSIDLLGGVKNEYRYEEYVFITGKPIKFTGTKKDVTVTEKESKGKLTETYKFSLTGTNGEKLTRNFTYTYDVTNYDQVGQSSATGEVTKFTEKITVDKSTYTLVDYQLSKSTITDKRPASDYYLGDAIARKTYTTKVGTGKNAVEAEIVVTIDSRNVGYENFWGATETQLTNYNIVFPNGEEGTVKNSVSTSKSMSLDYSENNASLGSFDGSYKTIKSIDTISEYTYDLPASSGKVTLNNDYNPVIEMLKLPSFRDLSTHWARTSIEKLYSLGVLDDDSNFFSPNTSAERYDFAISIGKAIDLRVLEERSSKSKATKSVFNDVKLSTKDYNYLEAAVNKGVIKGTSATTFAPVSYLTREQAATIIVRALGLEGKAPDPSFTTGFKDDKKISNYARDAVYVVSELGLMIGNANSTFNPTGSLTRAEAAVIIGRFLEYLENDLKQNYREDILFFE